ncbi:UNVERIFIED_CONTAM: hypothetical protein PYX00_011244 [Menopon gallinae]|uniref:Uncharacterized protein n=1 Tax=Menopon gallinae TaxID=328185 RepID=A0AAW2H6L4_9NEOP
MVAYLEQLPRPVEYRVSEHTRVPEFVVKRKRERLFTLLRPFLSKIEGDIAEYQSLFTDDMLADARERHEAVRSEVEEIERKQLKAALCTVRDVDTGQFSKEFCGLLSNEILSGLEMPSQKELDSLSKMCDALGETGGNP